MIWIIYRVIIMFYNILSSSNTGCATDTTKSTKSLRTVLSSVCINQKHEDSTVLSTVQSSLQYCPQYSIFFSTVLEYCPQYITVFSPVLSSVQYSLQYSTVLSNGQSSVQSSVQYSLRYSTVFSFLIF